MPSIQRLFLWAERLLLMLLLLEATPAFAQSLLPPSPGEKARFSAFIEMPGGYVSGICVMRDEKDIIQGAVFNEFGISCIDFSYNKAKDRVRLHSVQRTLRRWYVKRLLKKDLRSLIHALGIGNTEFHDERYGITYRFTPLTSEDYDDETEK